MPLISIEVTPDIATKIRFLAESGVFAVKNGSVTLHIKNCHLSTIKTELFSYAPLDNKNNENIMNVLVA